VGQGVTLLIVECENRVIKLMKNGCAETVSPEEIDLPTIWAKVEELSRVRI